MMSPSRPQLHRLRLHDDIFVTARTYLTYAPESKQVSETNHYAKVYRRIEEYNKSHFIFQIFLSINKERNLCVFLFSSPSFFFFFFFFFLLLLLLLLLPLLLLLLLLLLFINNKLTRVHIYCKTQGK